MSKSRTVVTALMILSLSFALVGCGRTSGGDEPQTEPEQETVSQEVEEETSSEGEEAGEPDDAEGADVPASPEAVATTMDADDAYVSLVDGEWGTQAFSSVDKLATSIIAGDVNVAIVPPDTAAALYNATGGSLMAIDAVCDGAGVPAAVTVVRMTYFAQEPDSVVAHVARHQQLVDAELGEGRFLRGSAMQREVSDAIADAYVDDPSRVGGELPPDNFYFLG